MLSRNARHSQEAGSPLVAAVQHLSKGPVPVLRANHDCSSRRLACRLGIGKVRGHYLCGPGVPNSSAPDVPHGIEGDSPPDPRVKEMDQLK